MIINVDGNEHTITAYMPDDTPEAKIPEAKIREGFDKWFAQLSELFLPFDEQNINLLTRFIKTLDVLAERKMKVDGVQNKEVQGLDPDFQDDELLAEVWNQYASRLRSASAVVSSERNSLGF